MREILFRGKRIDNGEWIHGFLVIYGDECPIYRADNTYYLSDEDAIKAWNRRTDNAH